MTDRARPERLIEVLDEYFDGVTGIVVKHEGLVDKIVGDAVHALFNVPFDLIDHPARALECAIAIMEFAREYSARPVARALGFGRTRIGLETGPAIVGDVGGTRKLDYTAHGKAVNAAARLEQANKEFGTTVLVGPNAAAVLASADLMPLGGYSIRGMEQAQQVFTVWPPGYNAQQKAIYIKAIAEFEGEPDRARAWITELIKNKQDDPILARLTDRLAKPQGLIA
jgi:adenylate cyclase